MRTKQNFRKSLLHCFLVFLAVAVTVTMTPVNMDRAYAETGEQETVLTVNDTGYTKEQILQMESVVKSYTYTSKQEEKTDYVKGVLLEELLKDFDKGLTVEFGNVDGYTISRQNMALQSLIDGQAILAYQCGTDESSLEDVYDTSKDYPDKSGCLRLYTNDNQKPDKMINSIKVTESGSTDPGEEPTADLIINGDAATVEKSYTIEELKADSALDKKQNIKYSWTNRTGTNGESEVTGVTVKSIIEAIGLKTNYAEITIVPSDEEHSRTFNISDMYAADIDNNYPLLAWKVDGEKNGLTLIIGKKTQDDQNKSSWIKNIKKIEINIKDGKLAAPASFKAARAGYSSIKLTWKSVTGADGYSIEKYDSSTKKYKPAYTIKDCKTASKTITGLKTGTSYAYRIRAFHYNAECKPVYSNASASAKATPTLSKPGITKLTAGSKKITVKWTKVSGATGYKLYRATSKSGNYKLIKTTTSTYYTNKSLTKGKKYYYKVKAYRMVSGKKVYSSYSSVKYCRAK